MAQRLDQDREIYEPVFIGKVVLFIDVAEAGMDCCRQFLGLFPVNGDLGTPVTKACSKVHSTLRNKTPTGILSAISLRLIDWFNCSRL